MSVLKSVLFHTLMTFRGLILTLTKLVGFFAVLMFLLSFIFGLTAMLSLKIMLLATAVSMTFLSWWYDRIVLALRPPGFHLILTR
jgi:hypothetical protein